MKKFFLTIILCLLALVLIAQTKRPQINILNQDTLIGITPQQLKQINLIFEYTTYLEVNSNIFEEKIGQFEKSIKNLNNRINIQNEIINQYKNVDSIRLHQIELQNIEIKKLGKNKTFWLKCKDFLIGAGSAIALYSIIK